MRTTLGALVGAASPAALGWLWFHIIARWGTGCPLGMHRYDPLPADIWAPIRCHRCGYSPDADAVKRDVELRRQVDDVRLLWISVDGDDPKATP